MNTDDEVTLDGRIPAHGELGHICDGDKYQREGNPDYVGPHVTMIIRACGSTTGELRSRCACGWLSGLFAGRPSANVAGWLHLRQTQRDEGVKRCTVRGPDDE